jgi:hypothetical protein
MKGFITIVALAMFAVSPASAAAKHHNEAARESNVHHLNRSEQPDVDPVIRGGKIMGADPDPNVRSEMMREYKRGW